MVLGVMHDHSHKAPDDLAPSCSIINCLFEAANLRYSAHAFHLSTCLCSATARAPTRALSFGPAEMSPRTKDLE